MLRTFTLRDGKVCETSDETGQIRVFINPSEEERKYLTSVLKLDEHTLASSLDPDELSRLEFEPEHVALIFKRPRNYSSEDQLLFRVASTGMFLFKDRLVIVNTEDVPLFDGKQFSKLSSIVEVMLRLIYRNIFHYLEHLKTINMMTDALEKKITFAMENRYLLGLFTLQKSLVYYLNALGTNSSLIDKLKINAGKIGFSAEAIEFLDDIIIENAQCYRQAEIHSNILAGLMDARASVVSNNLNVLMKTLNLVTIGIMVPTLVVSAFSMNVGIPMHNHPHAFWLIMGLAALSVGVFILVWRRIDGRRL